MKKILLTALTVVSLSASAWSQVATVDGIGGVATLDPRYPLSYANIGSALTDVLKPANDIAPGNTIQVTVPTVTETAGLLINALENLTVKSTFVGGSHVKLQESGVAIGAASAGMVISQHSSKELLFQDLIFTPTNGAAGAVNARLAQVYNSTADTSSSLLTFDRCYFTAIRPTGHPQAGSPVLTPFTHAASADTIAARNAELRAFDGGGAANAVELRQNGVPVVGSGVTWNFNNCVFTHTIIAAAGSKGGGIVVSRNGYHTLNINGCVFSFNSGSGIRTAVTATDPSTVQWNIVGTSARPNIFYKNGWMEDTANAARSEGIYMDGGNLTVDHTFSVGNFQDGIEKQNNGNVNISNTISAQNHSDLDTTNGTAPDAPNVANLKLSFADSATVYAINLTSVTLYNALAATNDVALYWGQANTNTITAKNVVYAGAGDQVNLLNDATNPGAFYTESNSALVQNGPDALESPFITVGASITAADTFRVTDDPQFASTTFTPVWAGNSAPITGLQNYLKVTNLNYAPSRATGAGNVTGGNPNSSQNASVADYMLY